jgi:hypothetical protein
MEHEPIDIIYMALLHYKPEKRYTFLRANSDVFNYYDDASLIKFMSSFSFPKIYNTSIGKYAVFIENETKPLVFFNTREKALNVAQKKADSGIHPVYVVDVPCVEIDDPKDFRYNVNENKYYTQMISNVIDDSKDIEIDDSKDIVIDDSKDIEIDDSKDIEIVVI